MIVSHLTTFSLNSVLSFSQIFPGSPKYFGPLLHFLRSGMLDIPPDVSHTALQKEAEFYSLTSVVTYCKQLEDEERRKNEKPSK